MNRDISRWLKNDLGLRHMSEADPSNLIFHPRHGNLCRRLVKFLFESTLCAQKYPNVYVKEDHEKIELDLQEKNNILRELVEAIEAHARTNEDLDTELNYLKMRLDYIKNIDDFQQTSARALDEIANRPNFGIEQVSRVIDKSNYLSNTDIASIYSFNSSLNKLETHVTQRHMASVDTELNELTEKINVMHHGISSLLDSINDKIDDFDCEIYPKEVNVNNLVALKIPEFEEVILNPDDEDKETKEANVNLCKKVVEINKQVCEMTAEYETKKFEIIKSFKKRLEKCSKFITSMQEIESFMEG